MFNRRVVIVSGKGGVGKSSVTAALAVLAARQGKRVLVVEFAGQCAMAPLLGGPVTGYEEVERRPNLFTLSVTPEQSMEEYLVRELHSRRLYQLVFKNNYIGPFIAAVPGLEDLVSIGKVMDLERAVDRKKRPVWDLILADAPATGQGLNLLRVPKAMMDMTRMGPFYQNTKLIQDMLVDPDRTVLNLVTLPEEMPVNETIEMHRQLARDVGLRQGYVIVNNLRAQLFTPTERALLPVLAERGAAPTAKHPAIVGAVLKTAAELNRRAMLERAYVTRLTSEVALPLIELPALARRNLGPAEVELLAEYLAEGMRARELGGGVS
jgi:anion-transporting  ArsA/GET3 family ATPase